MKITIILALEALNLLFKGWNGHMEYALNTKKVLLALEEIPIVKEFPEVFPDELSGLPP